MTIKKGLAMVISFTIVIIGQLGCELDSILQ